MLSLNFVQQFSIFFLKLLEVVLMGLSSAPHGWLPSPRTCHFCHFEKFLDSLHRLHWRQSHKPFRGQ